MVQCKVGKVIGNLKALRQLVPEGTNVGAVVQHMPTLLLSDMNKVRRRDSRLRTSSYHCISWHGYVTDNFCTALPAHLRSTHA